jgi:nucleotide-binding universal stress UspA family protein
MYDPILLPVDTSAGLDKAIEHAIDAADRYDSELHVLHVVDAETYSSYPGDEYVHGSEGLEHALDAAGREAIREVADTAEEMDVETTTVLRRGVPHEQILRYMDEAEIELTIIGSKHRPGEYRQMLGSVADRVTKTSDRPVTIVKTPVDIS